MMELPIPLGIVRLNEIADAILFRSCRRSLCHIVVSSTVLLSCDFNRHSPDELEDGQIRAQLRSGIGREV